MRNLSITYHSLVERRREIQKSESNPSSSGDRLLLEAPLPTSSLLLQVLRDGTLTEGDELIGSIDGGIFAAALSPNGSQLLLLTGLQSLIILSTDSWEVIHEAPLASSLKLNNIDKNYSVVEKLDSPDDSSLSSDRLLEASIAWRFDAQRFALTGMDATTNRRVLRIFSADTLMLIAEGRVEDPAPPHPSSARKLPPPPEPLILHGPVSWNFDGSLVATAQRLFNPIDVLQIAFFEANGLRHRELVLARGEDARKYYVDQLQWSFEGNTILIVLSERSSGKPINLCHQCAEKTSLSTTSTSSPLFPTFPRRLVQIFHRDNYTWDLKFERHFEPTNSFHCQHLQLFHSLKNAEWDAGHPNRLKLSTLTTLSEFVEEIEFSWVYSIGEGCNSSCVATIGEAGTIRLTPFSMAQVPPPMAFSTLFFSDESHNPCNVVSLCLLAQVGETITTKADFSSTVVALLTSSGQIAILPVSFFSRAECKKRMQLDKSLSDEPTDPVHIGDGLFLAVGDDDDGGVCDIKGGIAASLLDLCLPNSSTKVPFWSLRQLTWLSFTPSSNKTTTEAFFTCVASLIDCTSKSDGADDDSESSRFISSSSVDHILVLRISLNNGSKSIATIVHCSQLPKMQETARLIVRPVTTSLDPLPVPALFSEKTDTSRMTSVVHTSDGSIFSFSFNASKCTSHFDLISNIKEPCSYLLASLLPTPAEAGTMAVMCVGSRSSELLLGCGGHSSSNFTPPLQLWPSCGSIAWHGRGHLLFVALGATPALRILSLSQLAQMSTGQLSPFVINEQYDPEKRGAETVEAEYAGTVSSIGSECVLENGARLVTCAASQDLVVLQAPRGNIETIVPVTLSLCRIRALLDSRPIPRLGKALELVRLMRIDMNILCDHNESQVFTNAAWLREAVRDVATECAKTAVGSQHVLRKALSGAGFDRWDMFLAALSEDNVCDQATGKYASPEPVEKLINDDEQENGKFSSFTSASASEWLRDDEVFLLTSPSKVNRICSSLRSAFLFSMSEEVNGETKSKDSIYWQHPLVLSVISSYARQSPADLEKVLLTVQKVAEVEISSSSMPLTTNRREDWAKLICVTGDAALSHAITVCDSSIELLYTAALGLYDLRLAHTLAQRGQQDPKEYVPFLASLVRLSQQRPGDKMLTTENLSLGQLRVRIAVDIHLGRWGLTLKWCLLLTMVREYQLSIEDTLRYSRTLINLEDGPEVLVSAAIDHPAETALSIAYTYPTLYPKLVGLLQDSSIECKNRDYMLRVALLAQSWSIAGGLSSPLSDGQIADQLLSQGLQRDLTSSPCLRALVSCCPDGLLGAVRSANDVNVCAAIHSFLSIKPSPANFEALCLASAHPSILADSVLCGEILNLSSHVLPDFDQQGNSQEQECLLAHIALYLLNEKDLMVTNGANDQPTTEWTQTMIMDISKRLLNNTRNNDARLSGARILLKFFGASEADDGVEALCDLERWSEARAAAAVCNRSADLIPRVDERFSEACAESLRSISEALVDLKTNLEKLAICRALQKELGVGIGPNVNDQDEEDGASAAPSVLSFVSTASSKSSGTFSHLSRNSDTQQLTSRSSTLRLGGVGGSGVNKVRDAGVDELHFGSLLLNPKKNEGESKSSGRRREKKQVRARPGSLTEEKELLESLQRIKSIAFDERYVQLGHVSDIVHKKLKELQSAVTNQF